MSECFLMEAFSRAFQPLLLSASRTRSGPPLEEGWQDGPQGHGSRRASPPGTTPPGARTQGLHWQQCLLGTSAWASLGPQHQVSSADILTLWEANSQGSGPTFSLHCRPDGHLFPALNLTEPHWVRTTGFLRGNSAPSAFHREREWWSPSWEADLWRTLGSGT